MSGRYRAPPRNHRKSEERFARWRDANDAGQRFRPRPATGRNPRAEWVRMLLLKSDLRSTERLVGIVLQTHGDDDGANIYPGIRLLAKECDLSQRAVCRALDALVRRGYLRRRSKEGSKGAGKGLLYLLMVPSVLTESQHRTSVLTGRQHSADPGAVSADANDTSVLTQRQQTIPSTISNTKAGKPDRPRGELADARRAPHLVVRRARGA
jgi:helix-turn-helix protein